MPTDADKNQVIAKWCGWKYKRTNVEFRYLTTWVDLCGTPWPKFPEFDLNFFFAPGGPIEKLLEVKGKYYGYRIIVTALYFPVEKGDLLHDEITDIVGKLQKAKGIRRASEKGET